MSTPPPPPPSPPKGPDDKSPSDEKEKASPKTGETSAAEEEEILSPDEEAPSLDDDDDDEDESPKDEKKPRRKRSRRRDRKKRRRDKKTAASEDADDETTAKREKREKPKEVERPKSYKKAGPEVQAYMDQLQGEEQELNQRNKYLIGAAGAGVLLLLLTSCGIHRFTTGSYAVLDNIEVKQNPIDVGRLEISYDVVKPGKVRCRRTSGNIEFEQVDTYGSAGNVQWSWSRRYQPGKTINITVFDRGWLSRRKFTRSFPTTPRVDVVVLMDTTRSMGPVIGQLGEKSVFAFANKLEGRGIKARYALIGFGDTRQRGWLDERPFTKDVLRFHESIQNVARFDGGDLPDSALDALEKSLSLRLEKGSARCFYLVTDAPYHEPTRSGKTAEQIAEELKTRKVLLRVFSKPEYEKDYAKLLGETGRFMPIQSFGQVIREGRTLGD